MVIAQQTRGTYATPIADASAEKSSNGFGTGHLETNLPTAVTLGYLRRLRELNLVRVCGRRTFQIYLLECLQNSFV